MAQEWLHLSDSHNHLEVQQFPAGTWQDQADFLLH